MLGVLKRTCTQLTDMNARRILYHLSLVKSHAVVLCYGVWSPVNTILLSRRVEKVQRRATKWITTTRGSRTVLQRAVNSFRSPAVNLRPRNQRFGIFVQMTLYGYIDININNYVCRL
jgi:hypothetical protein